MIAHVNDEPSACRLRDFRALPVKKTTRGVVRNVRIFCGKRELSDDISLMALRGPGSQPILNPNLNPLHTR